MKCQNSGETGTAVKHNDVFNVMLKRKYLENVPIKVLTTPLYDSIHIKNVYTAFVQIQSKPFEQNPKMCYIIPILVICIVCLGGRGGLKSGKRLEQM